MNFPFLNRLSVRKVTVGTSHEAGKEACVIIEKLLSDLPDILLACVVEIQSGRVLAWYTTSSTFNPNHISLRYAKLLRLTEAALTAQQLPGGPLTDMSLMLDDQLHTLRPMHNGQWYCFLAVHFADANLGMATDILRRHTTHS